MKRTALPCSCCCSPSPTPAPNRASTTTRWPTTQPTNCSPGNDYLDRNDRDTAMPFFLTIIGNHEHDTDRHTRYLIACSYAAIGDIYYQQSYYSEAFDSFTTAIRLCEQQGFDDLLPEAYNNLGKIYCTWQDYTKDCSTTRKALEAARPSKRTCNANCSSTS